MIWNRVSIIRWIFRQAPDKQRDPVAGDHARRWRRAFQEAPELAEDLIRLGGVLTLAPARLVEGQAQPDPIDPMRLSYDQGRRDFALELLALGKISIPELNQLLEDENVR